MAINFDQALGFHEKALSVRAQRAEIIANNLANSDTPNFKARDINFREVLQAESQKDSRSLSMQGNNDNHLNQTGESLNNTSTLSPELFYRTPTQPSIDGNTVDEHIEHAEFMENALAFQTSFTFLNSKFKGLMTAIRGE
ncbi:MAG: flagellar basal body rod protein FlgB [Cellvibrionaceae bacterium]